MDIVDNSVDTRIKKTLSYRYVVYICIALAFFFGYFHRTAASAMSADITAAFNISPTALGLFGSMYFYAYAVGQLPASILADRWGIRHLYRHIGCCGQFRLIMLRRPFDCRYGFDRMAKCHERDWYHHPCHCRNRLYFYSQQAGGYRRSARL